MAYMCVNGNRECNGCLGCKKEWSQERTFCPVCDWELEKGEKMYKDIDNNCVGCQHCMTIEICGED